MKDELLRLENICYEVPVVFDNKKSVKKILTDISFSVFKNSIVGITGESGGGKTTLAKIIAGLIKQTNGTIRYHSNLETPVSSSPIQILFQNNGDVLNPFRTVNSVLDEALKIKIKNKNERLAYKNEILAAIDFSENLLIRKGYQLSGGEQQRAALMRLLAVKPELLILDEPFSAQDFESQISFLKLFKDINEKFGTTIICVSHDILLLKALVDEMIVIYNGTIVEKNSTHEITTNPSHPYTKYLFSANTLKLAEADLRKTF